MQVYCCGRPGGGAGRRRLQAETLPNGAITCQIDGGLKCFGHPVGATGLRMVYEVYLQLQGRAGARQRANLGLGLTHNLGGAPFNNVAAVSILGRLD